MSIILRYTKQKKKKKKKKPLNPRPIPGGEAVNGKTLPQLI